MKYIKKFNEELLPSSYRSAAYKLQNYKTSQNIERASKLRDYADEKDFGFYNMHFATQTSVFVSSKFTEPKLIGIYYSGLPVRNSNDEFYSEYCRNNNLINSADKEDQAEEAVQDWIDGGELCINFEFGLRPTQEAIKLSKGHNWLVNSSRGGRYTYQVPMFTIQFNLSEWNEGLEEYDSEAKWQAERHGGEFTPSSISDFFEWTQCEDWTIHQPMCQNYAGMFSDRRSAQKFLSFFKQTMESETVKDSIMDILRIVGVSGPTLERILNSYKKVRIHGLFDEVPSGKPFTFWFNKSIT